MARFEVRITNLDSFRKKLHALPDKIGKRIMRQAIREGAKIFEAAAKQNAPAESGAMREGIGMKMSSPKGETVAVIGSDKWYSRLVEKGHKWVIVRKKRVIAKGKKAPDPFMTRTFEQKQGEVTQKCSQILAEGIEREWGKLGNGS